MLCNVWYNENGMRRKKTRIDMKSVIEKKKKKKLQYYLWLESKAKKMKYRPSHKKNGLQEKETQAERTLQIF